jgi:hypothetical protein
MFFQAFDPGFNFSIWKTKNFPLVGIFSVWKKNLPLVRIFSVWKKIAFSWNFSVWKKICL